MAYSSHLFLIVILSVFCLYGYSYEISTVGREFASKISPLGKEFTSEISSANKKFTNEISAVHMEVLSEARSYGCNCEDWSCGCCAHFEVSKIGLNDTGCINITYLPKEYGISFTMTIDKLTIYNETISARNPPPICFGAPMLKEFADLCIHFYDLDASKTKLHGCVAVEARMHKIVIAQYKVGCFNIGKSSISLGRWKNYHLELIEKIHSRKKNSI